MKGIILAGGKGTRLHPITRVVNKHLLPVGNSPMIYHPILKMKEAGIIDQLVVTNREDLVAFQTLLGKGENLGVHITYKVQNEAKGIADAVFHAKDFAGQEKLMVLLGDNIFQDSLRKFVQSFKQHENVAKVLLKHVPDPERYGVAALDTEKKIIASIVEKPDNPPSQYCVTGIYFYDHAVFDVIESIAPSRRGEMEITDVNNIYIQNHMLTYEVLQGWWIDAGTHEALYKANKLVNGERV